MRLKMIAAALMFSTALSTPARADPVTLFVTGIISSGLNAIGVSVAAQAIIGQAIIGFASTLGSTLLSAAASFALNALLAPDIPAPRPQDLQANFTLDQKARWYASGELRIGGGISFAEAKDGVLYKQVFHADAEITEDLQFYLNDIPVTLTADGFVTTGEFHVADTNFFRLQYRQGTIDQAAQARLIADFPEWTTAHLGAGIADTLLTIRPVGTSNRAKVYRHRGVLGLGEPDVTRVACYGRYYDPRNDSSRGGSGPERADDPSTWGPSLGNLALLIAQHRLDRERFAMDPDDINWDNIAEQADICDEPIVDRYGQTVKRWRGAVLINKNEETNIAAENRMLAACDGIRFEDEEGRFGIFVGKYVEPDLVLTDADIFDIASVESDDGESQSTHLYGLYTEPAFAYKESSTAVFVNTDVWQQGQPIRTNSVPLHILLDHNTTCRAVKSASKRQSAKRILAVSAGLRARRARTRRFVRLNLGDANLSGVYEVAPGTTTWSEDGLLTNLILISTAQNNWTLLPGEEGERPNFNTSVTVDKSVANIAPADMQFTSRAVAGNGVQLVAAFPVPGRPDRIVQIQYRKAGETIWQEFSVRTEDGAGTSGPLTVGAPYELRWRVTTISGGSSNWADIVTITPTGDTTPPSEPVGFSALADGSIVAIHLRAPNDPRVAVVRLYRAASDDFSAASDLVGPIYCNANQVIDTTDAPGSGSWRYWTLAESASGAQSDPIGPQTVTL